MENSNILITFIIPAYNCEKYLKNTVNSIISQKLKSYEILIIDDGSTDCTLKVAEELESEYNSLVKVFTKTNGGAASARNFGLRNASGKYITFVDSDDLVFGTDFRECLVLIENHGCDILLSDISLLIGQDIIRNEFQSKNRIIADEILEYISLLPKFPGSSCSKIFSREFLNKNNLSFMEGIVNEDIEFMLCCFECNPKLYHSMYSWYLYRQGVQNSVTNTVHPRNCIDMFTVIDKHLDKFESNPSMQRILCYEYTTLFFFLARLKQYEYCSLKKSFDKYRFLLTKRGTKEKIINIFYSLFGLRITSHIVKWAYCMKRRNNNEEN